METKTDKLPAFALSEGGPLFNLLKKLHVENKHMKVAILAICLTWLPLLVITAIQGTLYSGAQLPFLNDFALHARMLVALPMFILIGKDIDKKVVEVLTYLSNTLMSSDEKQLFLDTAFKRAKKLTSSPWVEVVLLVIIVSTTYGIANGGVISGLEDNTTSWMGASKESVQTLSIAGYWTVFFSIPVFQLFILRWLWRYFVWILLLFRMSKAKLNLLPTHADHSGGLGIIVLAQRSFNYIFVAGSVLISGHYIRQLLDHPDSFNAIRSVVLGYIVVCLVLLVIPLVFFAGKLLKTKEKGMLDLGILSADLSRKFENEWVKEPFVDKRIAKEEIDPSLIFDYGGMYDALEKLRLVPITMSGIIGLAVTLFVPFIPILFIHFSVGELLQKIMGLLV